MTAGEVRVYQFSDKSKPLEVMTLVAPDAAKQPRAVKVAEEAGLQLKLRVTALSGGGEVVAVTYSPAKKAMACLDKQGGLSFIIIIIIIIIIFTLPAQAGLWAA
jgi:hypothetical protein